jgi:D-serine deaminase-like pyridoxal phosphate-dependent protein
VGVWIKIDAGYHRTGILWNHFDGIATLAHSIAQSNRMTFKGLLTHSGHAYRAQSPAEVTAIYLESMQRLRAIKKRLGAIGFQDTQISIGDTPSCSIVENFSDVDEIRPGNFVFYDITQLNIGSCQKENIAVAVACPVVAKHPERNEIVIYGGAVHLSKDFIVDKNGNKVFGYVAHFEENGWSPKIENTYVSSISQEHGIIKTESDYFEKIHIGDVLLILPVHSCLTANLMRRYLTLGGTTVTTMG